MLFEREKQRHISSICWFIPEVATVVEDEQGWNQEPGSPASTPAAGAGASGHLLLMHTGRELDQKRDNWYL